MGNYTNTHVPITTWAEDDRPREKLMLKGKQSLSDAELIAIIIGSGSREESAVSLAQSILQSVDNDLDALGKKTIADLQKFKGVGPAKAISIAAAVELGRRRQMTAVREKPKITSSREAYNLLGPMLMDLMHEEFWILIMNRGNKVLRREQMSTGGTSGTVIDPKMVFRKAIDVAGATSIIMCHNHPSGNAHPSPSDIQLTKRMKVAGEALGIRVVDHLIIAGDDYYSFGDEGMM